MVDDQRHAPAALPSGKTIVKEGEWAQGRCRRVRKSRPPPARIRSGTVQPVASRYTDWAILTHIGNSVKAQST